MEDSNCLLTWFHFLGYTNRCKLSEEKKKNVSLRMVGASSIEWSLHRLHKI